MAPSSTSLQVKLFADGADIESIRSLAADPMITGFTTNPTLMRKAGVTNYDSFGHEMLDVVGDRPVSFEVFADTPSEIEEQALKLASWGDNVFVKIPITTTNGASNVELARRLAGQGVKLNVTALMTVAQVEDIVPALAGGPASFVSVFAGRIADTGRDPIPIMRDALSVMAPYPTMELIWASPRELLNVIQADEIGCHIITATTDILAKLGSLGKDLTQFSLETVQMFFDDATASGFTL